MERETGPAEHERVVAERKCVSVYISKTGRSTRERLLRHSYEFIPLHKDQLWVNCVVSFDEAAIPTGRTGARRKRRIGRGTGSEVFIVRPVLEEQREIQFLHVDQGERAFPVETLVADASARKWHSV